VGFRLLLALLAFGLLTRLVESAEALWRGWRGGASSENAPRDASHRPWSKLGTVGIYLGGLIVFVGAIITNVESWHEGPLSVVAGESVPLSNSDNLTLRLTALDREDRCRAAVSAFFWSEVGPGCACGQRLAIAKSWDWRQGQIPRPKRSWC
jgi:hypothetical protein